MYLDTYSRYFKDDDKTHQVDKIHNKVNITSV